MSNILQDAIKMAAPKLAAYLDAEIEANKPAIEARLTGVAGTVINKVRDMILGALPANGLAASLLKPEVTAAATRLATEAVAASGGEVAAGIAMAEAEITNLGAQLAAMP